MAMTIPSAVQQSTCDLYMLLLFCLNDDDYARRKVYRTIDQFIESLVWRVQTEDEYEPDPSDVQHIGSDSITIEWNDYNWSVDAMLMLLVDADKVAEKHEFMNKYNSGEYDHSDIGIIAEYERFKAVKDNEHTVAILSDAQLGRYEARQFLKRYLFWLAIYLDTRCERLACKANNVLVRLEIGWPSLVKVRNIRRALKGALLQYAYGYCSPEDFEAMLRDAYSLGYFLDPIPDTAADEPDQDCLFNETETKFEPGPWPILVLRSHRSDQFDDNNAEEEEHEKEFVEGGEVVSEDTIMRDYIEEEY